MQNNFDPKIKAIMRVLRSRGFVIKGIRQGIRLKLKDNLDVDIYTLKFDADKLRARLKLRNENRKERFQIVKDVSVDLQEGLKDISSIEEFKFSRCISEEYYYYARLFMVDVDFIVKPEERTDILVSRRDAAENDDLNVKEKSDLQKIVDIFEPVDSKMYREALDGLGLPRTSILRVSLMRVFRSVTDPDELQAAIYEESARITDEKDRSDLGRILTSNYVEFLDPVIRMLHQTVFDDQDDDLDMEVLITDFC